MKQKRWGMWIDLSAERDFDSAVPDARMFLRQMSTTAPIGKLHYVIDPVRQSVSVWAYERGTL